MDAIDTIGEVLWFSIPLTPLITIPFAWKVFIGQKKFIRVLIGLAIAFVISLLGFSQIAGILVEILEVSYPALIALAIMNIVGMLTPIHQTQIVFWGVLTLSIGFKLFG